MGSRIGCLAVALALSFVAIGATVKEAYPRHLPTIAGALLWGVWDGAVLLLVALIAGVFVARDRHAPLPTLAAGVPVALLVVGVVWALVYVVALGL